MTVRQTQKNLYKGPMLPWNQDALTSLKEDLMVNVNVKDSGMINCLTKVPAISPGKPSIGILRRRETMVVQATVGIDQMGKIIDMLLGKEDEAFRNFCTILEQCGAGVWSERLKERARAFKKATEEDCQQADEIGGAPLPSTHKPNAIQVLDHFRGRFIEEMDASLVVHDLFHDKIISDGDYKDITRTPGQNKQNRFLHLSLKKCTDEVFKKACEIFIKSGEDGNARMKALGEEMVAALNTAGPGNVVLESDVSSGESSPSPSSTPISSARRRGTSPKEQVTSEPDPQLKKKHPQPNDRHTNCCSTRCVLVCVLVVVGLCGGIYWIYSNQGEAEMSADGKPVPKQDGWSYPDSKGCLRGFPAAPPTDDYENKKSLPSGNYLFPDITIQCPGKVKAIRSAGYFTPGVFYKHILSIRFAFYTQSGDQYKPLYESGYDRSLVLGLANLSLLHPDLMADDHGKYYVSNPLVTTVTSVLKTPLPVSPGSILGITVPPNNGVRIVAQDEPRSRTLRIKNCNKSLCETSPVEGVLPMVQLKFTAEGKKTIEPTCTSPKEQIISEPQLKKEHPQPNDRHTNRWSTEDVLVWVLVGVVCLGLVGGGIYWIYSNQGEAEMSADGKPVPKQDGWSHPDSKVPASSQYSSLGGTSAEFLEKHQDRFISDMDSKKIAEALQRKGVIPPEIAAEIANSLSTEKANGVLYNHLHSQASVDDLKLLFELCSKKKGYRKMSDFGKYMLEELEQGGGSASGRR